MSTLKWILFGCEAKRFETKTNHGVFFLVDKHGLDVAHNRSISSSNLCEARNSEMTFGSMEVMNCMSMTSAVNFWSHIIWMGISQNHDLCNTY